MIEPNAVHFLNEMELHLIGDVVAVCWNLRRDDLFYRHGIPQQPVREGEPFILFVDVRESDGDYYLDEDNPVEGGLSGAEARTLANELERAAAYIDQLQVAS